MIFGFVQKNVEHIKMLSKFSKFSCKIMFVKILCIFFSETTDSIIIIFFILLKNK